MSEKNIINASEQANKSQVIDRRTYLKLAGMAGSGLGTGLGASALGSEFTSPARAAGGLTIEDFNYSSTSDMQNYYHFHQGKSYASLDTVSSTATSDASDSVLTVSGGNTKMIAYDDNDGYDLNAYPQVGDTITCWIRGVNATENINILYGAVDGDGRDDHYYVKVNMENSLLGMGVVNDGSATWLTTATEDPSFSTDTWYKLEIQWSDGSPNTHNVTLYDQNENPLASFTYDGSDSADPNFEGRGFGYSAYLGSSSEAAQFDYATTTGSSGPIGKYQTVVNFNKALGLSPFDFERGEPGAEIIKASEYSGPNELGGVYNGRRGLKLSGDYTEMISTSGLQNYPSAGDTLGCYFMPTGGADNFNISWGVQGHDDRYYVKVKPVSGDVYLFKYQNGDGTVLDSSNNLSMSQDAWYWAEIDWQSDGTQKVEIYDLRDNTLATVRGSDSTWTSGGIGFDGYFGDSTEGVFIDHVNVGEFEYHSGGWGIVNKSDTRRDDADSNSVDVMQDFNFFLDHDGRDPLGSDEYVHYFVVGSLAHAYVVEEDVTDPSKGEVGLRELMEQIEVTMDVNNMADSSNQYLYWNDQRSYAGNLKGEDWEQWKSDNWHKWATSQEVKDKAVDGNKLNEEEENQGLWDLFILALGEVPILGDFLTLVDAIEILQNDGSACEYYTDSQINKVTVRYDFCDLQAMILQIDAFRIEIPRDESLDMTINQEFSTPSTSIEYLAKNAMEWNIHIPAGGHAEFEPSDLGLHSTQ